MKVGILGSGRVGQALGNKIAALAFEVMLGTRDPSKLQDWLSNAGRNAHAGSIAETATFGEILVNATKASASLAVLEQAGEANLRGKILIDVSNPFVRTPGEPATLFVANTDSMAEQIQRTYPEVKVVKTLNTMGAAVMTAPDQLAGGDHDVFVSGNDAEAKAEVIQILSTWFGWKNIIDLGDITTARGVEMYMILWDKLRENFKSPLFNIKIVK